jgi:hypothetical protein
MGAVNHRLPRRRLACDREKRSNSVLRQRLNLVFELKTQVGLGKHGGKTRRRSLFIGDLLF